MKHKAHSEGRDLLIVDTGDLHDGNGLSDTTVPDGRITDEIFKYVDFDLLSIGWVYIHVITDIEITNCTLAMSQRLFITISSLGMKVA